MMRLCTFRDRDIWFKPDSTGHNKVGYMTADDLVIYPVRSHFVFEDAHRLVKRVRRRELKVLQLRWPVDKEKQVDRFFTENVPNLNLLTRGIKEVGTGNVEYFENPLKLPRLNPITPDEHETRWVGLLADIRPGDLVQVFDQGNRLSRLISQFDVGTWSHTAMYCGNGIIQEVITSGFAERPLTVYKSQNYRLGVYRHPNMTKEKAAMAYIFGRSQSRAKYNWAGAVRIGLKRLLGVTNQRNSDVSPNDLIWGSDLELVHLV